MTGHVKIVMDDINVVTLEIDGHPIPGLVRLGLDIRADAMPLVRVVVEPEKITYEGDRNVFDVTLLEDVGAKETAGGPPWNLDAECDDSSEGCIQGHYHSTTCPVRKRLVR